MSVHTHQHSRQRTFGLTFVVASLAWLVFGLDKLVVATALPNIRVDLDASGSSLEWTVNALTMTFAALLLTGSALGDRFGRRRVFSTGMAVFTGASALAGIAPDMPTLVVARALQGIGGALFAPVCLTMLSLATPPARRGAVFGAWGGVGAIGAVVGPGLGGLLTQTVGWRYAFWVNVPIGIALVVLAVRGLDESHGPDGELDVTGVVLGTLGLLGVVWGVMRAGEAGWSGPEALFALTLGVAVLAGFVTWERRAVRPVLSMRLFGNRIFAIAGLTTVCMYGALFGCLFFVSQVFQTGLGESPLAAGLHLMPVAVMPVMVSPVSGRLSDRVGPRPLVVSGLLVLGAALGWFALVVGPGTPYPMVLPGLLLMGTAAALVFGPITAAIQSAVGPHEQGQASGAGTTIREVAAVLGLAFVGAVFAGHGGFASPTAYFAGLHASVAAGALIAMAGAVVALGLPGRTEVVGDVLTPDPDPAAVPLR